MTLVETIANALSQRDMEMHGEVADYEEYEDMAVTAVKAYEAYQTRPRPRLHFVEGLQYV